MFFKNKNFTFGKYDKYNPTFFMVYVPFDLVLKALEQTGKAYLYAINGMGGGGKFKNGQEWLLENDIAVRSSTSQDSKWIGSKLEGQELNQIPFDDIDRYLGSLDYEEYCLKIDDCKPDIRSIKRRLKSMGFVPYKTVAKRFRYGSEHYIGD